MMVSSPSPGYTSSERTPLLAQATSVVIPVEQGKPDDEDLPAAVAHSSPLPDGQWKLSLLISAYASVLFLTACNATVITTTAGPIAETLHAYGQAATWVNVSYMIASSCTNPLIGRLSTIFSPVNLFLACTTLFTLGSLLTGLAPTTSVFLLGRVLTGCGAGGLFTTANVLLVQGASVKRRGLLIGCVNAVVTTGSSLGGVVGGAFATSVYGWRPAFLVQVPIAVAGGLIILLLTPTSPEQPDSKGPSLLTKLLKVDYLGILLLSASLFLFLLFVTSPHFAPWLLVGAALLLCAFVLVEHAYASLPIIPVSVLAHRQTLLGCLSAMSTMASRWCVLFFSPVWAIAVLGYHPAKGGASLIPTSFGFACGGLLAGLYIRGRGGYYWQCLASIIFFLSTFVTFYASHPPWPQWAYICLLIANGLATGTVLNYTLSHVLASTDEKAIVAGLYGTFRGLAPPLGAGVAGGLLQRTLQTALVAAIRARHGKNYELSADDWSLVRRLVASPTLVWTFAEAGPEQWKRDIGVAAYEKAIKAVFGAAIAATLVALVLQSLTFGDVYEKDERAGRQVITPRPIDEDGSERILED